MKVKKSRPVVARAKVRMPAAHKDLTLFYYTVVVLQDGHIVATQQPGPAVTENYTNTSTLVLAQMGAAIDITWFPAKPDPDTEARREGLLAVMDDILSHLPEADRAALKRSFFAVGHAWGARLEHHEDEP